MKRFLLLLSVTALGTALTPASRAAVLQTVPGHGGNMYHVELSYDAIESEVTVTVDSRIPELIPLAVSRPGDSFDPADPWYTTLDPSQRGLAFNNQYGFMYAELDPRPAGTDIWIRLLSASAQLEAYRYSASPEQWTPIFGTAGSTNLFQWNAMMFHPYAAAPAGSGNQSATFEAFLANTTTGLPVPGVAPVQFTLNWTNTLSAPELSIASAVVLSWSTNSTGYSLESAPDTDSTNWTTVTNTVVLLDGQNTVVLPPSQPMQVFRLISAP